MDNWMTDPEAARRILQGTTIFNPPSPTQGLPMTMYVDAVIGASKPGIPQSTITNIKWLKARQMYAEGYSMPYISKKCGVTRAVVQRWMESDSIDWNILRLKMQQLMAAEAVYNTVKSQLEQSSRIKKMVDDILDESETIPFRSKGEAIKVALELDDRRRLLEGDKTSKDVVVTLTSLIKAQQQIKLDNAPDVDEDKPEDLK